MIVGEGGLLGKEGSESVRYEIEDNLMGFWFKYLEGEGCVIEIKKFMGLERMMKWEY